jgi:hypothetical protein
MIRARPGCRASGFEAADELATAFERRCAAVGCVPEASVARVESVGLEDERAAREEEGFVTDES